MSVARALLRAWFIRSSTRDAVLGRRAATELPGLDPSTSALARSRLDDGPEGARGRCVGRLSVDLRGDGTFAMRLRGGCEPAGCHMMIVTKPSARSSSSRRCMSADRFGPREASCSPVSIYPMNDFFYSRYDLL